MTKHYTPGPWTVNHQSNCVVAGKTFIVSLNEVPLANVPLIAAAPEMLEALRRLIELGGHFTKQSFQFDEAIQSAWTAIEKAEGK